MAETRTSIQVLKEFFGTEEKPIVNKELVDLAKNDRAGYDELASLAAVALGVELQKK